MDLPIFIGNTYCLFVAKVLDLNDAIDYSAYVWYNMQVIKALYLYEEGQHKI